MKSSAYLSYFAAIKFILSGATVAASGVLIIPMPIFSATYKSACLARELKNQGYNVTVVLPDAQIKEVIVKEFDFDVLISDGMTKFLDVLDEVTSEVLPSAFAGSQMGMLSLRKFGEICYHITNDQKLFDSLKERKYSVAVLNMVFVNLCASVIPYKLSIPFIREEALLLDTRTFIHPAVFPVNMFLPSTDKMTYLQRLGNTLFYFVHLIKPDLFNPSDIVGKFAPEKEHITNQELQGKTELYLLDYDELIEYHFPVYPNMIPVGGLATRPPRELTGDLKTFMDSALDGAVIVSLGSIIKWMPEETKDTMVESFRRFPNLKFVFKFGKEKRIDGNIMFLPWLPQNDVLGHKNTKAFITHCGQNAQYDALFNSVPIIALPVNGDQHFNAKTMQNKGYGIHLQMTRITTDNSLASAIEHVLNDSSYKHSISNASVIFKSRPFTPAQRAAWWIDHVIRFGGSYLRPPVTDIPYYQFLMVDVFLGILALCIFIYITCYWSLKRLFRRCCKVKHKKE